MSRKQVVRSKFIRRSRDPMYGSLIISQMINMVMNHGHRAGNKSKATRMVYAAIRGAYSKCQFNDVVNDYVNNFESEVSLPDAVRKELALFMFLVDKVRPEVDVKSVRIGGANRQVPCQVPVEKGMSKALKLLIEHARQRKSGRSFIEKLRDEFIDVSFGRGGALNAKEMIRRMALANMVFLARN